MDEQQEHRHIDVLLLIRPARRNEKICSQSFLYALKCNMPHVAAMLCMSVSMLCAVLLAMYRKEYPFFSSFLIVVVLASFVYAFHWYVSRIFERAYYKTHGRFNLRAELKSRKDTVQEKVGARQNRVFAGINLAGWVLFLLSLLYTLAVFDYVLSLEPEISKWIVTDVVHVNFSWIQI